MGDHFFRVWSRERKHSNTKKSTFFGCSFLAGDEFIQVLKVINRSFPLYIVEYRRKIVTKSSTKQTKHS